MTASALRTAAIALTLGAGGALRAQQAPGPRPQAPATPPVAASTRTPAPSADQTLAADLDKIFSDPVLSRALIGVRVESLREGASTGPGVSPLIYALNSDKLVVPGSNMKLLTASVAADRLGWNFTYQTRLEAAGTIAGGTLHGDLIVVGGGDPSIASQDFGPAPMFGEWADKLVAAGVHRVDGRLIGDDGYFDDDGLGAGWAWDNLAAGYAAPSGALSYNENVAVIRSWPARAAGEPARVELSPPGHLLELQNDLTTSATGSTASVELLRLPGSPHLTIRGHIPAGSAVAIRTAAVDNPTKFFVEALRLALATRGITVSGGAWDIDDLPAAAPPATTTRRVIARRDSLPLSAIFGYFMKISQNFYGETLLKTIGRVASGAGTGGGRTAVRETLTSWGVPADAFVIYDGSGLSRYNYATAGAFVTVLRHVFQDERLRGPFVASLPVAGHDGTLETRMKGTALDARVEAKTGTVANVRALSGYLETKSGERLVFSMIANNFTAPSAQIDAVMERALARLAER